MVLRSNVDFTGLGFGFLNSSAVMSIVISKISMSNA
ncbi:hypothetical protein [Sulfolobus spindle-shaped virus]|nr:hypothetical protein [Sulfolobus spindle-shaped virus]AZG04124.1 hypothetical protein [Sulfolobus spindle-shaped virus]